MQFGWSVVMPATLEVRSSSISTTGYVDGLGRRTIRFDREAGATLECLQVRPELLAYEDGIRAQCDALAALNDQDVVRVRSLAREHGRLIVVSDFTPGDRLQDLLEASKPVDDPSGIYVAFVFLIKVLPVLSRLHAASLVHGALAPGRIIMTPGGDVLLAEAIFGTSLPRLNLSPRRLWEELQLAFGPCDGHQEQRAADLAQAAICALMMATGRRMDAGDPLKALPSLIDQAVKVAQARGGDPLSSAVRSYFEETFAAAVDGGGLTADEAIDRARRIAALEVGEESETRLAALVDYDKVDTPTSAEKLVAQAIAEQRADTQAESAAAPVAAATDSGHVSTRTMFGTVERSDTSEGPSVASRVRESLAGIGLKTKLAAAAILVIAGGLFAGRAYLQGETVPATKPRTNAAAAPAASAAPASAATPPAAGARTGVLTIATQPAGARVLLDGAQAGQTPLRLDSVSTGRHVVTIVADSITVKRTVRIDAGKVLALEVPLTGWVAIQAPIVLEISEAGRSLGSSGQPPIPLAPGAHTLTVTNRNLGYSSEQRVVIVAGEEAAVRLSPTGRVNLNAQPWAEVWVDGSRAGETPIANLQVPLGSREFLFRHPQFGERRITATVSTTPSALSVDFTKSQRP